jgi:hypothetical protein
LYAAFFDGLELIAIEAGYRFGWYSARFTEEWLRQQTAAGILHADISASEPTFRLAAEVATVLLGQSGTAENTLAALLSQAFADWVQLAQRLVEAWRHDRSGYTDADQATLADQQARFTALTTADLPGRLDAIPELAELVARQPLRVAELGCGGRS